MLVPCHLMDEGGVWDAACFLRCEDLDLCMRFRRIGWKVLFVPGARDVHEKGACNHHRAIFVEQHKHRGMFRFYRKFFRNQYSGVLVGLIAVGTWSRFALAYTRYSSKHIGRKLGLVRD